MFYNRTTLRNNSFHLDHYYDLNIFVLRNFCLTALFDRFNYKFEMYALNNESSLA